MKNLKAGILGVLLSAAGSGLASAEVRYNTPDVPGPVGALAFDEAALTTGSTLQRAAPAAHAQPRTRGQYGGGFIEFLMTGRDPGPPLRADPLAAPAHDPRARGGQPHLAGLGGVDPYQRPVERLIDPQFRRQTVAYDGPHKPGTIVIDTPAKFLYLVQPGGWALRYGIGVGRPGFEWAGVKSVTRKAEWPDWRPPTQMLKRRPDLPRFMEGGPDNPMGARALYLGSTLYRIHGTNEPHTIGQAVSSGCIRMINEDVIDLYGRVPVGAKVIVI